MVATAKPIGVIDALASGFSVLHRRIGLILIPILVELWYWAGVKLTAAPLISTLNPSADPMPTVPLFGVDPVSVNLMALLSLHLPSLVRAPSLANAPIGGPWLPPQIELTSWPSFLLAVVVLAALGVLLASVYLASLAGALRGLPIWDSLARLGQRMRSLTAALLMLGAIILGAAGLVVVTQQSALAFLAVLFQSAAFWVLLIFFFLDAAIFVGELGAVAAFRQSLSLVWRQFWACLGIYAVVQVIALGIPLLWARILGNPLNQPWLAPVAIVVHLYLLTGLAVGVMAFYRSRAPFLVQVQA